MANKQVKYTFGGANQDTGKDKHSPQFYFEAQHIKILSTDTQATGNVMNEKGNALKISIPEVTINVTTNIISYNSSTISYKNGGEIDTQVSNGTLPESSTTQTIIGHITSRDGVVIFTTDDLGMDCIWHLKGVINGEYNLELLFVRNLGFSKNHPIQAIFNYENENIQKVYWVDGIHQIRFLNITNDLLDDSTPLIDFPSSTFNFVGTINLSQPIVTDVISGGTHTAGMIQYAYNLYRLNSSQTKPSPLTELIPLDKGDNLGGGELNEVVGATPIVQINGIDLSYTHIKVYAIKYTSLDQIPSINLIEERTLDSSSVIVYDSGSTISSLSLEEFLFLGSDPMVPKHIQSKDNRLFPVNIKTQEFVIPDELDCRAYSFPAYSDTTKVYQNIKSVNNVPTGEALVINSSSFTVPFKHDSINLDYDVNKYQVQSPYLGAEGKFIKLRVDRRTFTDDEMKDLKFLKDREIYRFAIEFYNNLGQKSLPKWITDIKAPSGNLEGFYNTINVELTPEFYTWLNNYNFLTEEDKPVGYRILRANRTLNDRTILCQGLLSGMMVNSPRDSENDSLYSTTEKKSFSQIHPKLPNLLVRTFQTIEPLKANSHLEAMQFGSSGDNNNPLTEIAYDKSERKADTYQYTVMYQMYSPEIMFDSVNVNTSTQFRVVGGVENTNNSFWGQNRDVTTTLTKVEGKVLNGLSHAATGVTNLPINDNIRKLLNTGLIGDINDNDPDKWMGYNQWNREFTNFYDSPNKQIYSIFGSPELTERGQGNTIYANNSKYSYSNSLEGFLSDGEDDWDEDGDLKRAIITVNSYGAKCITFVSDKGDNEDVSDPSTRPKMETLYANATINNTNTALISELIRPATDIYFGGIYEGNSYEDKKRTSYISIGDYKKVEEDTIQINSPGDTFVDTFKFTRMSKTDVEVYNSGASQYTELVSFKVETSIDLKNRNDISFSQWDSKFQPRYDDYHKYNDVYSQQPTLVKSTDVDFTFQRIKNFDTRVKTTKLKTPNESIDSWTDILVNEEMDLDGKYGPINGFVEFKDNLYAFQDTGVAQLSINPRVQVQGSDGVGIELGTGGILYDYNYITTKSGSISKWGILPTKRGIYYYDAYNKGIGRVPGSTDIMLSDSKGLHTFFNNNYAFNDIKIDNPLLKKGAVFGYDNYNNDIYFTLLQGGKSFTWCFNEASDTFVDLKTYKPSAYIYQGEKLLLSSTSDNSLYEHYAGNYNTFFGQKQSSYVTLMVNPESDLDCVYDSIFYNSELYLGDIDQPNRTLTHIQAYNEYQNSGRIPLVVGRGSNIRRKFRKWRANIPRNGRQRIRSPWIYLKLELDNTSNYKMILNDIIVQYTTV